MAEENNTTFRFDLDAKDAIETIDNFGSKLSTLGKGANFDGLISGFSRMLGPIALAASAMLSFKAAFDLTLEGEHIKRIENQFDFMAQSVGLNAEKIKEALEKATGGMIDTTDSLKAATRAVNELGSSASRIPEIMEAARRVSKLTGMDTLEAFEKISLAAATGSVRALRNLDIIIDTEKAYRDYAKSVGLTVSTLSQEGKQYAVLDAILAQAKSKMGGINLEQKSLKDNTTSVSVALKDLWENFAKKVDQYIGPTVRAITLLISKMTRAAADAMADDTTNQKIEKARHQLDNYKKTMNELSEEIKKTSESSVKNKGMESLLVYLNKELAETEKRAKAAQEELDRLSQVKIKEEEEKTGKVKEKKSPIHGDTEAIKAQEAKFYRDLYAIQSEIIQMRKDLETDETQFKLLQLSERENLENQYASRIQQVRSEAEKAGIYTSEQASIIIQEIEKEKVERLAELAKKQQDDQLRVFDNQVRAARNAADGMAAAFRQGAAQAKKDSQDFGKQGQQTFESVKKGASTFFKGIGEGSKDAGTLMKQFLGNSLADYAEMKGEVLLAEGIGTGNGLQIAQGGALIALSAAIRKAVGGGESSGVSTGGASSGASATSTTSSKPELPEEQKRKAVTIQIQGNYFETDLTKNHLVSLIREATDATDFKYQQIGVG